MTAHNCFYVEDRRSDVREAFLKIPKFAEDIELTWWAIAMGMLPPGDEKYLFTTVVRAVKKTELPAIIIDMILTSWDVTPGNATFCHFRRDLRRCGFAAYANHLDKHLEHTPPKDTAGDFGWRRPSDPKKCLPLLHLSRDTKDTAARTARWLAQYLCSTPLTGSLRDKVLRVCVTIDTGTTCAIHDKIRAHDVAYVDRVLLRDVLEDWLFFGLPHDKPKDTEWLASMFQQAEWPELADRVAKMSEHEYVGCGEVVTVSNVEHFLGNEPAMTMRWWDLSLTLGLDDICVRDVLLYDTPCTSNDDMLARVLKSWRESLTVGRVGVPDRRVGVPDRRVGVPVLDIVADLRLGGFTAQAEKLALLCLPVLPGQIDLADNFRKRFRRSMPLPPNDSKTTQFWRVLALTICNTVEMEQLIRGNWRLLLDPLAISEDQATVVASRLGTPAYTGRVILRDLLTALSRHPGIQVTDVCDGLMHCKLDGSALWRQTVNTVCAATAEQRPCLEDAKRPV